MGKGLEATIALQSLGYCTRKKTTYKLGLGRLPKPVSRFLDKSLGIEIVGKVEYCLDTPAYERAFICDMCGQVGKRSMCGSCFDDYMRSGDGAQCELCEMLVTAR